MLQSIGLKRVGHNLVPEQQQSSFCPLRVILPMQEELPGGTGAWGIAAAKIKTKENQERASSDDITSYLSANE